MLTDHRTSSTAPTTTSQASAAPRTQPAVAAVDSLSPDPAALAEGRQRARFREAFEAIAPQLAALDADQLDAVNLDVLGAVTVVLGVLPNLQSLAPSMRAALPQLDHAAIEALETYACAAGHAHIRALATIRAVGPIGALADRATTLRETLRSDAQALVHRGLVEPSALDNFRGTAGYRVLAADLLVLANVLRAAWTVVQSRTAVLPAELDEAEALAERLITVVGERAAAPVVPERASEDRARAFTLLQRAYAEARRAVAYLRWYEGDADTLAPSLYAGRGNGNHRRREAPGESREAPGESREAQGEGRDVRGEGRDVPGVSLGSPEVAPSDADAARPTTFAPRFPGPFDPPEGASRPFGAGEGRRVGR